ncbi:hypothetical protein BH09ACT10_BH09ACT10_26970 [soil metagenome]
MTQPPYPGEPEPPSDAQQPDPASAGASDPTRPIEGEQPSYPPPPYGQAPLGQAPYGQAPPGYPPPAYGAPSYGPPPGFPAGGYGHGAYGASAAAQWGIHPVTGESYSDKSKLIAGLLQIFIPLGIGRFYIGNTGLGVAQLLVTIFTCGIGALWPFIDGIVILAGTPRDTHGRPLRDST